MRPTQSDTRHLDSLSPGVREFIDRLNQDQVIGPQAPGDGDLRQWWFGFTLLLIKEFASAAPGRTISPNFFAELELPQRTANEGFGDYSRRSAEYIVSKAFRGLSGADLDDWSRLYGVLELELARNWGGRRVRIPARWKAANPAGKVAAGLRNGLPLDEVFAKAGVSRATGYRILKRKQ